MFINQKNIILFQTMYKFPLPCVFYAVRCVSKRRDYGLRLLCECPELGSLCHRLCVYFKHDIERRAQQSVNSTIK
jgi:hypothetical protein